MVDLGDLVPGVSALEADADRDEGTASPAYLDALRRVPRQRRGREKVARILDAAAQLIQDVGYEGTVSTPALIIERSGVAAGSFYTYFTGPDQVIDVLALRFMDGARANAEAVALEVHDDWRGAADRFFDTFVGFYRQPAVRQLWLDGRLSPVARRADDDTNAFLAEQLNQMLHRSPVPPPSANPIRYRVAIEIYDYAMRLAFRSGGDRGTELLDEARRAFLAYLAAPDPAAPAQKA